MTPQEVGLRRLIFGVMDVEIGHSNVIVSYFTLDDLDGGYTSCMHVFLQHVSKTLPT